MVSAAKDLLQTPMVGDKAVRSLGFRVLVASSDLVRILLGCC